MTKIENIKQKVATFPLERGGSNFKTHYLIEQQSILRYKPTLLVIIISTIIPFIGLTVLAYQIIIYKAIIFDMNWISILISFTLMGIGLYLIEQVFRPRIFDKTKSMFYGNITKKSNRNTFPLKNIVAIQIIGEYVENDNGSFRSFELNLVLDNCSRRNVIDHNNLKSIIKDAKIISDFLGVPIWHATSHLEK